MACPCGTRFEPGEGICQNCGRKKFRMAPIVSEERSSPIRSGNLDKKSSEFRSKMELDYKSSMARAMVRLKILDALRDPIRRQ